MLFKKLFSFLVGILSLGLMHVLAQDQKLADSLSIIYQQNELTDSLQLDLLSKLSFHEMRDLKKGVNYADELISLSEKAGNKKYLRMGYFLKGTKERLLGNLEKALSSYLKSAEIARELNHLAAEGESYFSVGDIYSAADDHTNAMQYYYRAINTLRRSNKSNSLAAALLNTGDELRKIKKYDSALLYFEEAKLIYDTAGYIYGKAYGLGNIGMVYASTGKNALAEKNLNEAISILEEYEDYQPICDYLISLADVYLSRGDEVGALKHAQRSLQLAEQNGLKEQIANAGAKLSDLYERIGDPGSALKYYKLHVAYTDSTNNIKIKENMALQRFNYEMSQKDIEVARLNQQNILLNRQKEDERKLNISLTVILGLAIIILFILFNNNRIKQKAYKTLNIQKQETEKQQAKAETALTELQLTQKQLIQSAKMASLGELTAGIAHEIQNPLNFVNNFSDVSVELLDELKQASNKLADPDKTETERVINDLADNLKKISVHGQRADSIVKGMLLHSRTNTGKKEPTNINALADEYLRLSYHGLRAKDKSFNANFTSHFDDTIGKVELVPQDIGRVLLNLFNNAFYSVNEKKKQGIAGYEPVVSVSTKKAGNNFILTVKDNGLGIPQKVLDKVFQPFFTTKPTGQGTGLGLSLSYDIINAHGGQLKVETKEGEFAEFVIQLPITNYTV